MKTVFPNETVRAMVRDICQEIVNTISTGAPSSTEGTWLPSTSDAYAYGYAKGAFDAMARGGTPLAADFAKFVLVPVAIEGAAYVKRMLAELAQTNDVPLR